MKKQQIYALYKGDKYITDGTVEEIAKFLGIKYDTVRFYKYPAYKKRYLNRENHKRRVLVKL